MKKINISMAVIVTVLLSSCSPDGENTTDTFDQNTMKGSWEFISATDGHNYGSMKITSIGHTDFSPYENRWVYPNPWISYGEEFAIKIEENDIHNIQMNPSPLYIGLIKTMELLDCSTSIGGVMLLKNATDGVTYSYRRTGN